MTARNEQLRSLALAIVLSVGAGVIWGVVVGFSFETVGAIVRSPYVHEDLVFLRDGTPMIESYGGANYSARTYRTLEGKPVEVESRDIRQGDSLPGPRDTRSKFTDLTWEHRIVDLDEWYEREAWFLIHDGQLEGHAYCVGYDRAANARIGYIGRNGLRSDEPPLEDQFPADGRRISIGGGQEVVLNRYTTNSRVRYLLADDGLWRIHLKKRTATLLRKDAALISGAMSYKPQADPKSNKMTRTIVLRTPDRILVLRTNGNQIESYRLPAGLRDSALQWISVSGDRALVQANTPQEALAWTDCDEKDLFEIDTTGKVTRHRHVNLQESFRQRKAATIFAATAIVPSPGVFLGTLASNPWGVADVPKSFSYPDALLDGFQKMWPMFQILIAIGVVTAILCYRRQRKYGLPWTWMWTVFVLLFGVPAYLGYLAHRAWPARLSCPHCGRPAPRDRAACFACGRDFPAPAAKETEVFA